jgi:tetratricopeptide (TPR) repeat protein
MGAQIIENGRLVNSMESCANNNVAQKAGLFEKIIEILLVGLLALMPLSFGAVQAWSEEIVILTAALIALLFCSRLIVSPQQRLVRTWAYVPVVIFVLIPVLQLVPLPKALLGVISPNTLALRMELLGNMPGSDSYLKWMPLSLYPAATKHDLRVVLAVLAVFVVVLNIFRKPAQIKRLLWSIALIGGMVAAITLAQNIFGNGKIYWFISTPNSRGYSGPFINHSNYGQFINLTIAAALGALIVRIHEVFSPSRVGVPEIFEYIGSSAAGGMWLLIGIISICLATVFLSLSRGGIISMLAAMAFTAVVLARTESIKRQWWLFVVISLLAFSCVLYTGFDAVCGRLTSLRNLSEVDNGRIQILKDIAVSWTRFPMFGTGLGTHRYVYPMFDQSYIVALATYAENEYAQVLEETGLLGLGALLVFGTMICLQYLKSIRNSSSSVYSMAYGLGFGIVAILIHSMADFGQHIPANGFLTAIFCAMLVVLGGQKPAAAVPHPAPCGAAAFYGRRWLRLTTTVLVCSIFLWAARDADRYRIAEGHWNKAQAIREQLAKADWQGTEFQYARLIRHAQAAVDSDSENIRYRYWLNVYRYRAVGGSSDPYNDETTISKEQTPQLYEITDQLRQVCMLCPTYGPAYSMLGQIEKYVLGEEGGSDRIRKSFRLAKNDPIVCFVAGCSDASEGDIDSAAQEFARAIKLDGRLYEKVATIYIDQLSRPDLAIAAAGEDTTYLYQVFVALSEAQYPDLAQQAQQKMTKVLEEKCNDGGAAAWEYRLLGSCYKTQGRNEAAIDCYRKALRMKYDQVQWRFELANLLSECDKAKEAMDEARVCLQLNPGFTAAKNLLAECSVQPSVLKEDVKQR